MAHYFIAVFARSAEKKVARCVRAPVAAKGLRRGQSLEYNHNLL